MGFRLIYLDIDETLVDSSQIVPTSAIAALRAAQARGIRVGLATGRMYSSAKPFAEAINADAPLILYNGALVETFRDRRVLFQKNLPLAHARRALELLRGFDIHCNLYVGERLYVERWNRRAWESMIKDKVYAQPVGDLVEFLETDPVKLLLIGEGAVLEAFEKRYLEGCDDPPHVVRSEPTYLEILAPGVSKGSAMEEVCRAMGVRLEDVVAFGDSFNDIEMLEKAGLGIAVEGSHPEVLKRADYVAGRPGQGGLAQALREFVL